MGVWGCEGDTHTERRVYHAAIYIYIYIYSKPYIASILYSIQPCEQAGLQAILVSFQLPNRVAVCDVKMLLFAQTMILLAIATA